MITQDRLLKDILFFIFILCVLALGLYLGETNYKNKHKEELNIHQQLMEHKNSVILIDANLADRIGFKPRKGLDKDWRKTKEDRWQPF